MVKRERIRGSGSGVDGVTPGPPAPGKAPCVLGNTRYNAAGTRMLHSLGAALRPASLKTGE